MTTPTNEEVRRQFEAWAVSRGMPLWRNSNGDYAEDKTGIAWIAYQAALTSPAVVALVEALKLEAEQAFLRDWLQFIAYEGGQSCCGNFAVGHFAVGVEDGGAPEFVCCGKPEVHRADLPDVEAAMTKRLNEVDAALAQYATLAGHE